MSPNKLSLQRKLQIQDPLDLYFRSLGKLLDCNHEDLEYFDRIRGLVRSRAVVPLLTFADSLVATEYATALEHFRANQLAALIRKYPFPSSLTPGINPEDTAIEKFILAERRCKWNNRRFRAARKSFSPHTLIIESARAWILRVLGESPNLESIYDKCDFGAGASVGVHGNATNIGRKLLAEQWSCTPSALNHAYRAIWANAQIRDLLLGETKGFVCLDPSLLKEAVDKRVGNNLIQHNNISFVPKTAKTHRSIAVEPLLNGFLQKGIDSEMRVLLRDIGGIDLSLQEPNQLMAREGSLGGFDPYATIDLSAASDSISLELVRDLLPPDWFSLLNQTRSPSYLLNDRIVRYEKFTSMGNGFCFPLETIIFAALTHGVYRCNGQRPDFRVYGDDIIVRRNIALHLIEVLRWCGFQTNTDKTFCFGPFRESCGADWYEGLDVRPVYLDDPLDDVRRVFSIHNSSLRSPLTEKFFQGLRPFLREEVPKQFRFVRPERRVSARNALVRVNRVQWWLPLSRTESNDTCFIVPYDTFLVSEHTRWVREEQRWAWKEILSESVADLLRHPLQNAVEYLAILRGSKSSQPLSLRRLTKARVRWV